LKPVGKLLSLDVHHGNVDAPLQRRVIRVVTSKLVSGLQPKSCNSLF
jgi:hypothetical protein